MNQRTMTNYDRLALAADWRIEQLEPAIETARYPATKRQLAQERNRLRRFVRFCHLATEFHA